MSKLTQQQPSRALYATVSFLATGLLFVMYNALFAKVPSPRHGNLGPGVANVADMNEARYNPYATNDKRRLAIVIPYLPPADGAPTFPAYFDLFAMSAAGSAADIDYLIFHCFVPPSLLPRPDTLPTNVKLIDLNEANAGGAHECGLAKLFTRVTDQRQKENQMQTPLDQLNAKIAAQIIDMPYMLVEYKPAFGHIFADHLKEYSHWGYSDLDVVFGDMSRWIDEDEWNDYDIVSYGFGDQDKLYLRGQFTFHRNDPGYINQIWRHCKYLSEMDIRYAHHPGKFESAEGCYSQAVLVKKDIKVKWAVKAFTDVGENSPIYTQGVYLSLGSAPSLTSSKSYQPKSVLYTAATVGTGQQLLHLPTNWFEDKKKYPKYAEGLPIQKVVGERSKVQTYRMLYEAGDEEAKDVKCMYWAPKTYQMDICTVEGTVASDEVVILEKGTLYKQKFVERKKLFPEGIKSFPFFHFQEWKRIYRTTELLPSHNIRQTNIMAGLIITKEGALPLFSSSSASTGWKLRHGQLWASSMTSAWTAADTGSTSASPSSNQFCLKSSPKGYPKGATLCESAASWPQPGADKGSSLLEDSAAVTIVRSPSRSSTSKIRGKKAGSKASWWNVKHMDANNDVTLTLTLQITATQMKEKKVVQSLLAVADSNLYLWGGHQPSVLLIHVESSQTEGEDSNDLFTQTIQMIKDKFSPMDIPSGPEHLANTLVAVVDSHEPGVSRKSLLNMAAFAAPTRWIISGLELERGLLLSKEASLYALREAKVYADLPGHVFVLPQFASTRDDTRGGDEHHLPSGRLIYSSAGADLLPSIRGKQTMVSDLAQYDCTKCAEVEDAPGEEEELDDGGEVRRRLTDSSSFSTEKSVEELIEDLWWDLSVADVYGTAGGFSGEARASLGAMAKMHDSIELSLVSLLDRKGGHLEYLRYFDKSPILLIDRLGPKREMMTLDLVPEVEDFGGRACFHLLRLAQLAASGYRVGVLPGAFAASYPNTRAAMCTESIQKSGPADCDCQLDSESSIKEILIDEVKRPAKMATVMAEVDAQVADSRR